MAASATSETAATRWRDKAGRQGRSILRAMTRGFIGRETSYEGSYPEDGTTPTAIRTDGEASESHRAGKNIPTSDNCGGEICTKMRKRRSVRTEAGRRAREGRERGAGGWYRGGKTRWPKPWKRKGCRVEKATAWKRENRRFSRQRRGCAMLCTAQSRVKTKSNPAADAAIFECRAQLRLTRD